MAANVCGNREERGGARRVVIGTVIHLATDDAKMIEVRGDDDEAVGFNRAWHVSDDVLCVAERLGEGSIPSPEGSDASVHERERLLETVAEA